MNKFIHKLWAAYYAFKYPQVVDTSIDNCVSLLYRKGGAALLEAQDINGVIFPKITMLTHRSADFIRRNILET